MVRRPTRAAAATAALVALAACSDPTRLRASLPTVTDSLSAYAITGTDPGTQPSALDTSVPQVGFLDNLNFDLAFDLDEENKVLLIPEKLVASPITAPRTVGIQKATVSFDQVTRAPLDGYTFDSVTVAVPGETVIIRANTSQCSFTIAPSQYSKLVIDSVQVAQRRIFFRIVVDPNCGFRSLIEGVPND